MSVRVGDYRHTISLQPKLRPEAESIHAEIFLPSYLEINAPVRKDLRGGNLTTVAGSSVSISAQINRDVELATVSQQLPDSLAQMVPVTIQGNRIQSKPIPVNDLSHGLKWSGQTNMG